MNSKYVSAMTLKSDKEIERPKVVIPKDKSEDQIEKKIEEEGKNGGEPKAISEPVVKVNSNLPLFSSRLKKQRSKIRKKRF